MIADIPECVSGDRRITVDDLRENGAKVAAGLVALGLREDDSIAVMLRNDFPYLEAGIGAGLIGVYTISVNWHFKGDEVRYILEDSGAKLLVIHADLLAQCRDQIPENVEILVVETPPEIGDAYGVSGAARLIPEGLRSWQQWRDSHAPWPHRPKAPRGNITYTSGTTGKPKGVRRQPLAKERQKRVSSLINEWFFFHTGMRTAVTGPMYHSVINTFTTGALRAGGSIVLTPRFEAEDLLRIIEKDRLTHLHLVPTMFVRLLRLPEETRHRYDLSSLEMVVHGAAPCPIEVKKQIIEWWGPVVYEYYGATEFGMATRCDSEEWLARPGTTGKAWSDRIIEIHDENGNALPANTVGEVYVSLGPLADFTYHNKADQRQEIEREGLVTAGDAGYLDEDGYLFLTDRKRDMIISGGVNIYPAEIEAEIAMHPKVMDSAVFSIPDAEFGETVVASVELMPGVTEDAAEIKAFLKDRLANYKIPRQIFFEKKLPRDDAGKIRKRELREPHWKGMERRI